MAKLFSQTSATDVLHAFGAVPPGFRLPTSARLHSLNEKHTLLNYGAVKLSNSNLFYKDLFYNPATSKVGFSRYNSATSKVGLFFVYHKVGLFYSIINLTKLCNFCFYRIAFSTL